MPAPLLIIFPVFFLFAAACLRLYLIEMKIMKKLKIVDPDEWKHLNWWFGTRAHPFRFRRYIKNSTISDPDIKKHIKEYRQTMRFAFITWAIFAITLIVCMLIFNNGI